MWSSRSLFCARVDCERWNENCLICSRCFMGLSPRNAQPVQRFTLRYGHSVSRITSRFTPREQYTLSLAEASSKPRDRGENFRVVLRRNKSFSVKQNKTSGLSSFGTDRLDNQRNRERKMNQKDVWKGELLTLV